MHFGSEFGDRCRQLALAGQFRAQICAQRLEVGLGHSLGAHLAQKLEDEARWLFGHGPILTASRTRVRADRPFSVRFFDNMSPWSVEVRDPIYRYDGSRCPRGA